MKLALTEEITASRRLLLNQYAFLDGDGGFSAIPNSAHDSAESSSRFPYQMTMRYSSLKKNSTKKYRYTETEIEQKAIQLQRLMWQQREQIWPGIKAAPLDVLDPILALELVGYDFELSETLGYYFYDGKQIEVAGMIDSSKNHVHMSRKFPHSVRNFTAAHEVGHALLHDARGLHRDRSLDGSSMSRDPIEYEADKFASYFLMPRKQITACFQKIFGAGVFFLNEETAFALSGKELHNLRRTCTTARDLASLLASATSYNGVRFASLANQFRVSREAMAIRLGELKLFSF